MNYCDMCNNNEGGMCKVTGVRVEPLTPTNCSRWERWQPRVTERAKGAEEETENQLKLFEQ